MSTCPLLTRVRCSAPLPGSRQSLSTTRSRTPLSLHPSMRRPNIGVPRKRRCGPNCRSGCGPCSASTSACEEASRAKEAAASLVEQSAAWWQQNGPAFRKAFVDKWAGVDWKALAEKDPAEVQRLIAERQQEETLLAEADRRGQADIAAARQQEEQKLQAARQAEHAKLAERLPDFFGPERARQTYDELSRFLFAKGIPADRIAAIYEAPVIELALSAMRFENAQRALRSRASGGGGRNPVKTTPTRIDPGPGNTPGNRNGADLREVGERFRQSGGASIADAAELIRLSGL
jgi:hypothetical protein